jgi:hypothetical protein
VTCCGARTAPTNAHLPDRPYWWSPAPAGIAKSPLCARLAGTIPDAVLLDADIYALDLVSVVPPNQDYPGFWRSMMRLALELAQNNVVVVYFSVMLPEQILTNSALFSYFEPA